MANETPQVTAADTAPSSASAEEPGIGQSLLGLADSVLSNSTGQGAAMGGLLGYLLSKYGTPGGVNLGVDMAKQAIVAPRSTTFSPSRYFSYSDYGARDNAPMAMPSSFGVPTGLGAITNPITTQGLSPYSRLPALQSLPARTFTSAGSGSTVMQNPTVTPRSTASLDPLTGALMGSAIGYLRDTNTASGGTSSGGTGGTGGGGGSRPSASVSGSLDTLLNAFNKYLKKPSTTTTTNPGSNQTTNPNDSNYNPNTNSNSNNSNTNSGSGYWTPTNPYNPPVDQGSSDYYPTTNNNSNNSNTNSGSGYWTPTNSVNNNTSSGSDTYWSAAQTSPYEPNNVDSISTYDLNKPMSNNIFDFGFKDGGMATPLMAEGGEVPHYYTYGTAIDPQQIMQNMAQGGKPQPQGGLHVPTVAGRHDYRSGSRVTGDGDGQSDDIPAMLADGEYVFDADTVAQLGNGSTKAGSDLLDRFREEIRSHKRSAPINKIPPPAKSPLAYLKAARSKKNG
jgi:hypothetical protein